MTTQAASEPQIGHRVHMKDAANQQGLDGQFERPIKITLIGAGSLFTSRLLNDVLQIPTADKGEIALVDIDEDRLRTMHQVIEKLIGVRKADGWTVTAHTDRREALSGSHYIVNCIEVSGTACVDWDNDIPLKYGIDQCIGDTIGPGGLFKALRTVPVWLDILRDARSLCPDAMVLNYTNPMNMMCLASGRAVPQMQVVGLCHSVQGTSELLAGYADVPIDQMQWECAGINHLAWFTKLQHKGQDLYQTILNEKFAREVAEGYAEADRGEALWDDTDVRGESVDFPYKMKDLIRKDMCLHFGAFITESSGHLSEYLPYYRKSEAGRKLLRLGYDGGSRFYASNWPNWRASADKERIAMVNGEKEVGEARSWEYASWIIEAREKDTPYRIYGNVMNQDASGSGQLISNLPADGCVEVACMVDRNGINPTRYGKLPPHMAGICASNMAMFDLAATACIEKSKEAAIYALLLDPLTSAVCTPAQIKKMALEMFDAEAEFLPGYR